MPKNELYEKNLRYLKTRDPVLARKMENCGEKNSCYGEPVKAKDGSFVASFAGGSVLFSTYNPSRDAEQFAENITETKPVFCLTAGLGCGRHINVALNTGQKIKILVVEKNEDSLNMLFRQFDFEPLLKNPFFFLTVPEHLFESLCRLYLPALFPCFKTSFLRPWTLYNSDSTQGLYETVERALKIIGADYSVQAHFGKIWMRNILRNLKTASTLAARPFIFPSEKTAHIIAAGPGLDRTLPELLKIRENSYIIAADTALQVLSQNGITADAVVTIDGQNISYLHFFHGINKNTLLVADLCAHPYAAETAVKQGNPVLFAQSAHPLCQAAADWQKTQTGKEPFLKLDVTSGTVTAAAVDFAVKAGFNRVFLHGADFAYIRGKPYAKATYLDNLYAASSNRLDGLENRFTSLMFRTKVSAVENGFTSETLISYARALEDLIQSAAENGTDIRRFFDEGLPLKQFSVKKIPKNDKKICITQYSYLFSLFLCRFIEYTVKAEKNGEEIPFFLLPFAAWVQNKNIPQDVLKLAKSVMERYNKKNYV